MWLKLRTMGCFSHFSLKGAGISGFCQRRVQEKRRCFWRFDHKQLIEMKVVWNSMDEGSLKQYGGLWRQKGDWKVW